MTRVILFLFLILAAARFIWRLLDGIMRAASGPAAPGARGGGPPASVKMLPCPVCGTPIQRIQYAANEANYCPACQTGGRLLADRGLSRLLKDDWPKSLEELERRKANLRSEI